MRRGFAVVNWIAAVVLSGLIVLLFGAAYMIPQHQPESTQRPTARPTEELLAQVETVRLTQAQLQTEFTRRGVLQPSERVTVSAQTSGRVLQRHVSVGDPVKKGDPILELDGSLLKIQVDRAQARQKSAQVQLEEAESQVSDAEESDDKDVTRDAKYRRDSARAGLDLAVTQLAEAENTYQSRVIQAPLDGTIAQIWVDRGELAASERQVAEIIVTNPMGVAVSLTADEVAYLGGQVECQVRVSGKAAGSPAKFRRIAPVADPLTKRFAAELEVDNGEGRLRAGMPVDVTFRCTCTDSVPLLPRRALTRRGDSLVCFRMEATGEGYCTARQVNPQLVPIPGDAAMLRVHAGLNAGDEVALSGLSTLKDGMHVHPNPRDDRPE
jgi:RND family efflux transporter MFP subunit